MDKRGDYCACRGEGEKGSSSIDACSLIDKK